MADLVPTNPIIAPRPPQDKPVIPIYHFTGLPPIPFVHRTHALGDPRTPSDEFLRRFYGGCSPLPQHMGVHGYHFCDFTIELSEGKPLFELGAKENASLLESLAFTPHHRQPGYDMNDPRVVGAGVQFERAAGTAAGAAYTKPRRGCVGNTRNVAVINWFLISAFNTNACSLGLTVGQKCGGRYRDERGEVFVYGNRHHSYTTILPPHTTPDREFRMLTTPDHAELEDVHYSFAQSYFP